MYGKDDRPFHRYPKNESPQRRKNVTTKPKQVFKEKVNYVCLTCNQAEAIPLSVVRDFDMMDDGDSEVPPQFTCEACGGEMYP